MLQRNIYCHPDKIVWNDFEHAEHGPKGVRQEPEVANVRDLCPRQRNIYFHPDKIVWNDFEHAEHGPKGVRQEPELANVRDPEMSLSV